MHKTNLEPSKLQAIFVKNPAIRGLPKVTSFTKVENSIDHLGLSRAEKDTYRKFKNLLWMCGGVCDWATCRIVAWMKMSDSTYDRHRRKLESVMLLDIERRRIYGCRDNETNLIRLGGSKNEPQSKEYLKTTTPAPVARCSSKSDRQLLHELRRAKDEADSRYMRARYEAKGWRIKALAKVSSAAQAVLGMFRGDSSPGMSDATLAELRKKHGAVTLSLEA